MTIGLRTLVLHPDYSPVNMFPLYTIPAEEAFIRVFVKNNARCVQEHDRKILTKSRDDLYWPSVIVNNKFYKKRDEALLRHETLYYRDHGICAYCENPLTLGTSADKPTSITCDHVMPQSLGGPHKWENVVASCKTCNALKDNNLPRGKWAPKIKPYKPSVYELIEKRKKFPVVVDDTHWIDFIGPWDGPVIVRKPKQKIFEGV